VENKRDLDVSNVGSTGIDAAYFKHANMTIT